MAARTGTRAIASSSTPADGTTIHEQARRIAMSETHDDPATVLWETPTHRLRLVEDPIPSMPESMGGFPVFQVRHPRHYYWEELEASDVQLVYGTGSIDPDDYPQDLIAHVEELRGALCEHLRNNAGRTSQDRTMLGSYRDWIQSQHGGTVSVYGPNQATDEVYVAVGTRALHEYWFEDLAPTQEPSHAELDEVRAWLEGDVHGLVLEQRHDVSQTLVSRDSVTGLTTVSSTEYVHWEPVEAHYGYYGPQAHLDAAEEIRIDACSAPVADQAV